MSIIRSYPLFIDKIKPCEHPSIVSLFCSTVFSFAWLMMVNLFVVRLTVRLHSCLLDLVSGQREFVNPAVTDPAPCACDLSTSKCEPTCCCDPVRLFVQEIISSSSSGLGAFRIVPEMISVYHLCVVTRRRRRAQLLLQKVQFRNGTVRIAMNQMAMTTFHLSAFK
jgi:hypothetical protein